MLSHINNFLRCEDSVGQHLPHDQAVHWDATRKFSKHISWCFTNFAHNRQLILFWRVQIVTSNVGNGMGGADRLWPCPESKNIMYWLAKPDSSSLRVHMRSSRCSQKRRLPSWQVSFHDQNFYDEMGNPCREEAMAQAVHWRRIKMGREVLQREVSQSSSTMTHF